MLIKIGPSNEPSDVVDLLMACHDRIRLFVDLARRLADAHDASADEIRDAAMRVIRYFSEASPLHVADEEESVMPRLAGREPALDAALQAMHQEHQKHEPQLKSLLNTCQTLHASPQRLEELRETLRATAMALEQDFIIHLQQEEKVVMPAIRSLLTSEDRDAMLAELRARRLTKD
jgi:hemerythrin-like domain-containing protein